MCSTVAAVTVVVVVVAILNLPTQNTLMYDEELGSEQTSSTPSWSKRVFVQPFLSVVVKLQAAEKTGTKLDKPR